MEQFATKYKQSDMNSFFSIFSNELNVIKQDGTYKQERIIESTQGPRIIINDREVLNLCANNYLGLANSPVLKEAACKAMNEFGLGMASVRFICGTQIIHRELEQKISQFMMTDDAILYSSCFQANIGLFQAILNENDAVLSDELNHGSIIDGIRLSKARRYIFRHNDMEHLELLLRNAKEQDVSKILVATDGIFSMEGYMANLSKIRQLCDEFGAIMMVDDSHGTGCLGKTGRGSLEECGVLGKVEIITSTFGKALGGTLGGFVCGNQRIIDLLRQRSRPYLLSNSLPPPLVMASLSAIKLVESANALRDRLMDNTIYFRERLKNAGFNVGMGSYPIVPIIIGDAQQAVRMAEELFMEGIYVVAFSYPVVPEGKARIRVQISSAHTYAELDTAVEAFRKVGQKLSIIS